MYRVQLLLIMIPQTIASTIIVECISMRQASVFMYVCTYAMSATMYVYRGPPEWLVR